MKKNIVILLLCLYAIATSYLLLKEGVVEMYVIKAYNKMIPSKPPKGLHPELIKLIDSLEVVTGEAVYITSGKRNGTGTSAHNAGLAVDVRAWTGRKRYELIQGALDVGFDRIGVYNRHIHLDIAKDRKDKTVWIGESK